MVSTATVDLPASKNVPVGVFVCPYAVRKPFLYRTRVVIAISEAYSPLGLFFIQEKKEKEAKTERRKGRTQRDTSEKQDIETKRTSEIRNVKHNITSRKRQNKKGQNQHIHHKRNRAKP